MNKPSSTLDSILPREDRIWNPQLLLLNVLMGMEKPESGQADGVAGNVAGKVVRQKSKVVGVKKTTRKIRQFYGINSRVWPGSLSVVCFYYLFFAEGCAKKKEMAELKQILETSYLPAESAFLFTLDSQTSHYDLTSGVSDTLFSYSPQAIADIRAAARKFYLDELKEMEDDRYIRDKWEFKTEKVKELFQKYNKEATGHAKEWALWGDTRAIYTPSQIYAKEALLDKKRISYAVDRENLLKSLDKTFQEHGLGPLLFDGHTLRKHLGLKKRQRNE